MGSDHLDVQHILAILDSSSPAFQTKYLRLVLILLLPPRIQATLLTCSTTTSTRCSNLRVRAPTVRNLQPPTCHDSIDNTLRTISDISVSPTEVRYVLLSLDPIKVAGPDKIPAKLLQVCAPHIYSSLCALFNKCLLLGKMPSSWKESNIVPILKGGAVKEVSNCRPISLLPLVSKVLERRIYDRVINHIAAQLHKLQFGLSKGKSTTAQLLQVLHNIGEKLDKRVQVDAINVDFANVASS